MENKRHRAIKILTTIVLAAALALTGTVPSFAAESQFEGAPEVPDITADAAMVMDAGSGQVIYELNGDEQRDPASVTKILNLLVCLDTLDFDEVVTVDKDTDPTESSMSLRRGEKIKIEDLVYCMMMWSANDAAEYLGYLAGGDMETFCKMMNDKAASFGATKTKYKNPNGLNPDTVNNLTTPHDIAVVLKEAMKDKRFREITGTPTHVVPKTNKHEERKLRTGNKCLWDQALYDRLQTLQEEAEKNPPVYTVDELTGEKKMDSASAKRERKINKLKAKTKYMYKGCIGGKTGYTSTAGGCYAGYAHRGNTDIIVVVMHADDRSARIEDAIKLWDYAYDNFKTYTAQKKDDFKYQQKVKRGSLREIELGIPDDLKVTALKGDNPSETVTTEIKLNEEKPMAPIKKGAVMGQLIAYNNGEVVSSQNLVALETAEKGGPLSYIGIADEDVPMFLILVGLALLTLFIIIVLIRAAKRNKKRRQRRDEKREAARKEAEHWDNERFGKH